MRSRFQTVPQLPHQVMRRATAVAVVAWLVVLALGLLQAGEDIDREVAAALHLASLGAQLSRLEAMGDAPALAALQRLEDEGPLRHLSLTVHDARGRLLVRTAAAATPAWPVAALAALHRALPAGPEPREHTWMLARPGGLPWRLTWSAARDSERAEAMAGLSAALLLVALGATALLAVMAVNVRHAFRPMRALLHAIDRLRGGDATALQAMPPMSTCELQSIADALRALGDALADAEAQRRALSHKVITLQEDERARLARELHDEFGQRLTAIGADAAWLRRRLAHDGLAQRVGAGLAHHAAQLQAELRDLLARLQPAGPGRDDLTGAQCSELLSVLVSGWNASPGVGARFDCEIDPRIADLTLPRELALTIYRISQEALTNAARHAQAQHVQLRIALAGDAATPRLDWQVADDGVGVADWQAATQRGSGLAGLRERVWAFAADLQAAPARPGPRPGLALSACFALPPVAARATAGD